MPSRRKIRAVIDANEAVASIAHRTSEVIAIYPITPASPMGEHSDAWSAAGRTNVWGAVPRVVEMQSEAGAAGALHGALSAGALATTFTASQGLLLMIPDLYRIAGELMACCIHVAARSIATHALSIFGDHSDVMACRPIGLAMLCSSDAQEAHDLAAIGHAATLVARVPFLHFFDGFRTSHELRDVEILDDDALRGFFADAGADEGIAAHRARGLSPDRPVVRGTAQNPDAFFQGREAANPFYDACPSIVQRTMDLFAARTGRRYRLFEYAGAPDAERVIVVMGSGAEAVRETVEWLNARGARVGVLKVRLYRPFDVRAFVEALPQTIRSIAVLDRTKEPGAVADPMFLDVVAALSDAATEGRIRVMPRVVGGRYGLSSKELTPAMIAAVFDALGRERPPARFTIGIEDDVTRRSLPFDRSFDLEPKDVTRAVFFGIGSDGTVSGAKSAIEIVGTRTSKHVQGYFAYDSRKSGTLTVSHLRISDRPIRSTYRIGRAGFVGCHQPRLLERAEVMEAADDGATLLINAPWSVDEAWDRFPREVQEAILARRLRPFVIDATAVAREAGLRGHVGTILEACFLAMSGVLPRDEALADLREAITKDFAKQGEEVVAKNLRAVERALDVVRPIAVPDAATATHHRAETVPAHAPDFVRRVTSALLEGHGDLLPVSAFPVDGTWPVGTSRWEKRALANELPAIDVELCIQCNKCSVFCPHAAIRPTVVPHARMEGAPEGVAAAPYRGKEHPGHTYVLQITPDDCTGCGLCVAICPAKDKRDPARKALAMVDAEPRREAERARWSFFEALPPPPRAHVHLDVKGSQLLEPLLEFSGACSACGETPYVKLVTQLFGDRALIANATGCSSIWGGNLPTHPWRTNVDGRGPAWANSLFEDDAEFGMGFRLALDARRARARALLEALASAIGHALVDAIAAPVEGDEAAIDAQRARVAELRARLSAIDAREARELEGLADDLAPKSVWIVGGDGWAYDIGYGGLDHVLASGEDVNVLVLDSEVYSNTGGQQSKATPLGAAAKFAAAGKPTAKKDLGLLAMTYGSIYVAQVSLGANDAHVVKVLREAESHRGPSLVIAHAPCIAHGYDLTSGADHGKLAVAAGVWPLYRWDPRRVGTGEPLLKLDALRRDVDVAEWMATEGRFRVVARTDPARYAELVAAARADLDRRHAVYRSLATIRLPASGERSRDESDARATC